MQGLVVLVDCAGGLCWNWRIAEALAGRISKECFKWLDGPVDVLGALDLPAVPLNIGLEKEMLPNAEKVTERLKKIFSF